FLAIVLAFSFHAPAQTTDWIAASNGYAQQLVEVDLKHSPESGSYEGLAQFDTRISQPTLADEDARRAEIAAVLTKLKAALGAHPSPKLQQDLEIMIHRVELDSRREDYERAHEVPFYNPSERVFSGIRILLDDQT